MTYFKKVEAKYITWELAVRKYFSFVLVLFLTCSFSAYSQIGSLFHIAKGAANEISKSKKSKLVKKYARNVFIESDSVTILRVPEERIRSDAKNNILEVQILLDKAYRNYLSDEAVYTDEILNKVYIIPPTDQNWDIQLYKNEIHAYSKYNGARYERQRKEEHEKYLRESKRKDSLRLVREKRQKVIFDSLSFLSRAERRRDDSLLVEERSKGFHFVNVNEAPLKEKPTEKSRTLATIGGTSYVKVLAKPVNGYTQIEASDLIGYIKDNELVSSLYNVNYVGADVESAKKMYAVLLTETPEQTNYNYKIFRRSAPQNDVHRQYYRGPRGGCYYYSASGKKVYVDHSYCN